MQLLANVLSPQIMNVVITESQRLFLKLYLLLTSLHLIIYPERIYSPTFGCRGIKRIPMNVDLTVWLSVALYWTLLNCTCVCVCRLGLWKEGVNPCCFGSGWSATEISKPRHLAPRWLTQLFSLEFSQWIQHGLRLRCSGPEGKTSTAGMQTLCSVCLFWEEARRGLFVTIKCQFSPENKTVRIVCVDSRSSLTLKGRNAQSLSHCLRTESHKYYIKVLRIARPRRCWPMYCRKSDWAKSNTVNPVVRVCIYFIAVVCWTEMDRFKSQVHGWVRGLQFSWLLPCCCGSFHTPQT